MPSSWVPPTLHYYLVSNPTISTFHWSPPQTLGSSLPFLTLTILSYLSLTLLLLFLQFPSPPPSLLRLFSSLHNLLLLSLSLLMALGCLLSSLHQSPSPSWPFCFPPNTPPSGPTFFWAHIFYLSKIYEFIDTFLILLSGSNRRLTFLHVYHHAVVVVMCFVWLETRQSLMPVALVTNAGVHVVMYGYYLSSSLGWRWRPRWKRAVTELQIDMAVCFQLWGFSALSLVSF